MLTHEQDASPLGKTKVLRQLTINADCRKRGKTTSFVSLDHLVRLTATVFDVPLAAIFIRTGDRLQLKAGIGLNDKTTSELQQICSGVISDNAPLILKDMNDQEAIHALSGFGSFSSIGFCACLPLHAPSGQPMAALGIGDVKAWPGFSEDDVANLRAFSAIAADLLKSRMAEQDRQASASELVALGHDIRTPMNGVIGMAELLMVSEDLSEKQHRRAEMIKRSGATLLSMIEPIFDIAKVESEEPTLTPTAVNLQDLLNSEFQRFQAKFAFDAPGPNIEYNLSGNPQVLVDAPKIKRLLSHFFEGTVALSPDTPVKFKAAYETFAGEVHFTLSATEMKLEQARLNWLETLLSYNDDTMAGDLGGLGLKLMACRRIAGMMGGDIIACRLDRDRMLVKVDVRLEQAPLAGTRVEGPSSEARDNKAIEINKCGIDILVAEDDHDLALLTREFLEDAGHRVTVAPSGAAVMKALDEKVVDIIFMDGQLLDMTGLEAAGHIRALPDRRSMLPIIALTGDVMAGDRERYLSAGMNDYLAKPVDCDSLIEMVNQHFNLTRITQN